MKAELWQQVQEILQDALELAEEKRPAFLHRACGGDSELRREVESLLDAAAEAEGFIEEPVISLRPDDKTPIDGGPDDRGPGGPSPDEQETDAGGMGDSHASGVGNRRIGPYQVLQELGRGGMGKVLQAVRADDEFEKVVALKLLKRGMDTEEIVRRFRHERQILANLDHPYIAELFDGGTTGDGLPYFVMEYVEGVPIDRYCDEHRLGVRERLELFRKVCSAVHFAHQNLVVHRDLKPGNILVTADGEPKLLDFGIAKLLAAGRPNAADSTVDQLTVLGAEPMTPDYASPEQILGGAITTASDVYTLGVLLYKLLTGHHPHLLADRNMVQLFQKITEEDPRKPSSAIFTEASAARPTDGAETVTPETISRDRGEDPRSLRRRLAGDLDAVLLKALRKEPKERYGSVERLSEDLRRHLEGLPVLARKGSWLYQTSKFVRRHVLKLAAAAAVLLVVFFGVRSMMSAGQAARERQVAESLTTLFLNLQNLDPRAAEEPGFAEGLKRDMAQYVDDLKLADILNEQARLMEIRGGFQTAEVLYRESLGMLIRLFGEIDPNVAQSKNNLALALEAQGKNAEAEKLLREALEIRIAVHGQQSEETATTLNNLGLLLQNMGDLEAAEPVLSESLEIRRQLYAPGAFEVGVAINNYAFLLQARGDYAEAEAGYVQALRIFRTQRGLDDHTVGIVKRNLATLLRETGDLENAEKTARQALEIFNKAHLKHWKVADAESVLGETLVALGRYDEAEPLLRESYTIVSATKGKNARQTREALARLEYLEEARRNSGLPR